MLSQTHTHNTLQHFPLNIEFFTKVILTVYRDLACSRPQNSNMRLVKHINTHDTKLTEV